MGWTEFAVLQLGRKAGTVWLIFKPGERYPTLVGKYYTSPEGVRRGQSEVRALTELSGCRDLGIPELLLASEPKSGALLSLQSAARGSLWQDELSADQLGTLRGYVERIAVWLSTFQQRVASGVSLERFARDIARRGAGGTKEEKDLSAALTDTASELASLPAVGVHGDLWPGNILADGPTIHVIDWETFHYGSPVEDLHNLLSGAVYKTADGAERNSDELWRIFFEDSPISRFARAKTQETLQQLGCCATPRVLKSLFVMFLLVRLAQRMFIHHSAWQTLAVRYVRSGMPVPFAGSM